MADPISILGLIGTIDAIYKWGKKLVATCNALAQADSRLRDSIVRVEACWLKIETQIEVVRKLEPQLNDSHKQVQQQILETTLLKLEAANVKLAGLIKKSDASSDCLGERAVVVEARRFKYAILRDSLAEAIGELEIWQGILDPSWFLMIKIAGPEVDQQLSIMAKQQPASTQKVTTAIIPAARYLRRALNTTDNDTTQGTVFLPLDGLMAESVQCLTLSPAYIARRAVKGQLVVLDPITCTSKANVNYVLRDIRDFARRLRHADPFNFGLLQCKGILRENSDDASIKSAETKTVVTPTGLSFVFNLPPTHPHAQSLRHRLLSGPGGKHDSLSARFDLARQLVKAVSYVHLFGFVHKNIRPEIILILSTGIHGHADGGDEASANAETAVLVGFDVLRDAEGKTHRLGDDDWEKNLYRHPQRQGRMPEMDYNMRHDIYSLGVCLLEIGLWESLIEYDKTSATKTKSADGKELEALDQLSLVATNLRPSSLSPKLRVEGQAVSGPE